MLYTFWTIRRLKIDFVINHQNESLPPPLGLKTLNLKMFNSAVYQSNSQSNKNQPIDRTPEITLDAPTNARKHIMLNVSSNSQTI